MYSSPVPASRLSVRSGARRQASALGPLVRRPHARRPPRCASPPYVPVSSTCVPQFPYNQTAVLTRQVPPGAQCVRVAPGPVPRLPHPPPVALTPLLPTQMAACPTPASRAPSAAASPTAPGPAAPAQWASWATGPTARTWTRWVPTPGRAEGRLRGGRGGSPLLVPTVRPGHRRLLLHEQQVPALRQHRPRVPLPALPASLQGHPALRGRPGGRADGEAGEQGARPFCDSVFQTVSQDLGRRRVGMGEGQRSGETGPREPTTWGRAQLWPQDHEDQLSALPESAAPASPGL